MTFFDRTGKPIAYCDNDEAIFLFSGEPVAYLYDEIVYSYSGKQLGRFEDGWIRDLHGYCVFFTEKTRGGGPARPAMWAIPAKSAKWARPAKGAKSAVQARPANMVWWSELSGVQFFK